MFKSAELLKFIEVLELEKGISKQAIIDALKEAIAKAYRKQLGSIDDALVRVEINPVTGVIQVFEQRQVVETIEDDFLEIGFEEVKAKGLSLNVGDFFETEVNLEEFSKGAAMIVKAVFRQKIAEAEKAALYELFKDKIGEMIVGQVEKIDERSAIINIGRTDVYLPASKRIPGEIFRVGDRIKLYVVDVESTTKGAQIAVSRTHEGFLKRVFEEELPEVYEGTVIIKAIAREAGVRSKVAVYSNDPNVDPAGACIGQNGSRIQKIVAQLGNAKDKEKIDIIAYTENVPLYLVESMKPAQITGIWMDDANKKAIMVIQNENLGPAIGRRGVNPRLASKLTGWQIDVKDLDAANAEGLPYQLVDQLRTAAEDKRQRDLQRATLPAGSVPAQARNVVYSRQDEGFTMEDVLSPRHSDDHQEKLRADTGDQDEIPLESTPETVAQPIGQPPVAPAPAPKPVDVPPPQPKITVVRTTKTLEELEAELEAEKARKPRFDKEKDKKKVFKKRPKDFDKPNDDIPVSTGETLNPANYMKIYDDEETTETEPVEEVDVDETELDFEDFDEYYDEEK
jgi:transcription termination/antitermination protein NusA